MNTDVVPFKPRDNELTEARVQRALMAVAWLVTQHGDVYAPLFDRLEQELRAMRESNSPVDRARQYLQANSLNVTYLKAAA